MNLKYKNLTEAKRGTKELLFYSVLLLVIGVLGALSSLLLDGIAGQRSAEWLQRSGSIMTALSAWVVALNEYTSRKLWTPGTLGDAGLLEVFDEYTQSFAQIRLIGIALSIFGAIVWGYADLWF